MKGNKSEFSTVQGRGEEEHEHERELHDEASMQHMAGIDTQKMPAPIVSRSPEQEGWSELPTTPLPPVRDLTGRGGRVTRGRALLLVVLLAILVLNASAAGFGHFFGPRGWGSVFNSSGSSGQNLLNGLGQRPTTPETRGQTTPALLTPTQIVDQILAKMTLDQKLGQMIMVRFSTTYYSPDLDAMLTQYHVGSVIEYQPNITSKSQFIELNKQIQQHGDLPMLISVDQEGGYVDRLTNLDGPQPSASTIGATGNPQVAYQQGVKDAQDLASYGINLNQAPVVDVSNVSSAEKSDERTYGDNPTIVTQMAEAYLHGLQQGSKVLGAIKHFPGLGDVSTDPHFGLPYLTRPLGDLNAIDWAPYKNLISKGDVYSIMVTHEVVKALDPTTPSSLSPKVVAILRNQLHFQGVIITDGLTMGGILNYYSLSQAAVMAVEAGDDLMMDPGSPSDVAQMVTGLKQAISSGAISQQHIDDSVRRILLLKYQLGLLHSHS